MVEIPEHLLQRSREARARLTGEAAPAPSPPAEEGAAEQEEPAAAAAAAEPAAAAPPPAPEPAAPEPVAAAPVPAEPAAAPEEEEEAAEPSEEALVPAGGFLEPKVVLASLPAPAEQDRPFFDWAFSPEPDSAARRATVSAAVWLAIAAVASPLPLLQIRNPALFAGTPFGYGRVAPAIFAVVLYGWLTLGAMAAMFFIAPRLCGAGLYASPLANLAVWLVQAGVAVGAVSILAGFSTGNPGLEMPYWAAIPVGLALLATAISVLGTALVRRERIIYVSLLFFAAAVTFGTLSWGAGYAPSVAHLPRTLVSAFAAHNMVGLWVGAATIGAVFYVAPVVTGSPLWSHRLAVAAFFSLVFIHPFTSGAVAAYGPGPDWLETVGISFAMLLPIPALAIAVTLAGTLSQRWALLLDSPALKFALMGAALLVAGFSAFALQSARSFSAVVRFTSFPQGTEVLLLLGAFSMFLFAFVYHALPRFSGRQWLSGTAAASHFWLTGIGVGIVVVGLWAAGTVEGLTWAGGTVAQDPANAGEGFQAGRDAAAPFLTVAAAGMAVWAIGQGVFVTHLLATLAGVRTLRPEWRGEEDEPGEEVAMEATVEEGEEATGETALGDEEQVAELVRSGAES